MSLDEAKKIKTKEIKKDFLDEAKKQGLDLAEDSIAALWKVIVKLVQKYTSDSSSFIIKMVGKTIVDSESLVLGYIDKIDGEDDEGR